MVKPQRSESAQTVTLVSRDLDTWIYSTPSLSKTHKISTCLDSTGLLIIPKHRALSHYISSLSAWLVKFWQRGGTSYPVLVCDKYFLLTFPWESFSLSSDIVILLSWSGMDEEPVTDKVWLPNHKADNSASIIWNEILIMNPKQF